MFKIQIHICHPVFKTIHAVYAIFRMINAAIAELGRVDILINRDQIENSSGIKSFQNSILLVAIQL